MLGRGPPGRNMAMATRLTRARLRALARPPAAWPAGRRSLASGRGLSFSSDGDEYDDAEYYEDDDDARDDRTSGAPPARRNREFLSLIHVPAAMDEALEAVSLPELLAAAKANPPSANEQQATTVHDYAAKRLDRSYAACRRVLHEACVRLPGLAPASALDFGAGLAPFAWAASEQWGAAA